MAVPALVQAGAGVTITTGTGTPSITGATAGNLIFLHMLVGGTTNDWSIDPGGGVTNLEELDGGDNAMEAVATSFAVGSPTTASQSLFVARAMANGTVSQDVIVGASGLDLFVRMYEFSGENPGISQATVLENGGAVYLGGANTSATIEDKDTTTNGADRLALNFVALNDDQAIGPFTGETGGDWVEAVAEYASATGTQGCLQLQTATVPTPGTISGGAATIGASTAYGTFGLAIIPAPSPPPPRFDYSKFPKEKLRPFVPVPY